MERDSIARLAFTLSARLWISFLIVGTELDPVEMVGAVDVLLRHQEPDWTAFNWILLCKRRAQLRLPERCESRQQRESVRLQASTLVEVPVVDRHVSKETGFAYGIGLIDGECVPVIQFERWEYWYVDAGEIVR